MYAIWIVEGRKAGRRAREKKIRINEDYFYSHKKAIK
jgi:hypothetical protein